MVPNAYYPKIVLLLKINGGPEMVNGETYFPKYLHNIFANCA